MAEIVCFEGLKITLQLSTIGLQILDDDLPTDKIRNSVELLSGGSEVYSYVIYIEDSRCLTSQGVANTSRSCTKSMDLGGRYLVWKNQCMKTGQEELSGITS